MKELIVFKTVRIIIEKDIPINFDKKIVLNIFDNIAPSIIDVLIPGNNNGKPSLFEKIINKICQLLICYLIVEKIL